MPYASLSNQRDRLDDETGTHDMTFKISCKANHFSFFSISQGLFKCSNTFPRNGKADRPLPRLLVTKFVSRQKGVGMGE